MDETKLVLPVDDDVNDLVNGLLGGLKQKQTRNWIRASYYDGKRAIRNVGTVIPPQYYRLGIVLGWSAKAVDILARRCNLDRFVWPDGDLSSLGADRVFDDNYLSAEVNSALISSLIHGVSFLINTEGQDDEPDSLIHVADALNATGEWNPRIRRLDNLLSVSGWDNGQPLAFTLYLDGETLSAKRDSVTGPNSGWQVEWSKHEWGVPVEPLVYKPRVGRPFGSSRISRTVMSLHDQALRTMIRLEGHADVYSYPEMWMLGADESIFKNPDGTPKPKWQVMLGRIKGIPDDDDAENPRADVKQFAASSPQPHLDTFRQQAQAFSGETSIPLTSLGVSDMSNPTSADSYVASREDLIAEAEGSTDDWSPGLRRSFIRSLAILNGESSIPDEWRSIDAKWRNPLHLSRAAEADAGSKVLGSAPWLADTEVGLELLGLDPQQVRRALAERSRVQGSNTVAALQEAAAARAAETAEVTGGAIETTP